MISLRKITALLLVLMLCFVCFGCEDSSAPTDQGTAPAGVSTDETIAADELVILYTNDVHNGYQRVTDGEGDAPKTMGYAALAAYKKQLEQAGETVILLDGGDAIQGEAVGTLSKGSYLVDIMNEVGYDLAVPGNHEFDFGMDTFLELANNRASYEYICCNFVDLTTGEPVFAPYKLVEYADTTVAYVGITTPESYIKSTPAYFKDAEGNYIYGFCEDGDGQDLYDCVQSAIDSAKAEGADYVIAVGHLGIDSSSAPWTSVDVIANTEGLTAFLDAHSHSVIESEWIEDADANKVLLCSTGTKLTYIAELRLDLVEGTVSAKLLSGLTEDDEKVLAFTDSVTEQFSGLLDQVVAKSEVVLVINDPEAAENRLIRMQETNLGNLCADAYRDQTGADVALVNGGGIRAEIGIGEVTYGDIINVHPFGNTVCMIEATGQEILDVLEMAYRSVGVGEEGGFLHVSGLTCQIDTSIASPVKLDDKGNFLAIEGERRVKNVMIGGEALESEKTYTVASHNYIVKLGGDGFTMLMDNKLLLDEVMIDNQALINYIQDTLGGVIPALRYGSPDGEGRIKTVQKDGE